MTCPSPQSPWRRKHRGTTLFEVLIASVLLVMVAVPIGLMLSASSRQVRNTDLDREVRSLMDQVMERVESTDLTVLWDAFGVDPDSPNRLRNSLGRMSPLPGGATNPLLLNRRVLDRFAELRLACDLEFRFMTRKELGIDASNRLKSHSGILHLQAGVATLTVRGSVGRRTVDEHLRKPIYCPMILGRPGLLLSQCPAVNPALRDGKFKAFP